MPNGIQKIVDEHMNHNAHRISFSRENEVNVNIEHKYICGRCIDVVERLT